MNMFVKVIGLMVLSGVVSVEALSIPHVDPAQLVCSVVHSDGWVDSGNGKNDLCLLSENDPEAHVFYTGHLFGWLVEQYLCELEDGELMSINKNIVRNDQYTVKAFGAIYQGFANTSVGIANHLIVKSPEAEKLNKPVSLVFKSNDLGEPLSMAVHIKGGRAPLIMGMSCNQWN